MVDCVTISSAHDDVVAVDVEDDGEDHWNDGVRDDCDDDDDADDDGVGDAGDDDDDDHGCGVVVVAGAAVVAVGVGFRVVEVIAFADTVLHGHLGSSISGSHSVVLCIVARRLKYFATWLEIPFKVELLPTLKPQLRHPKHPQLRRLVLCLTWRAWYQRQWL